MIAVSPIVCLGLPCRAQVVSIVQHVGHCLTCWVRSLDTLFERPSLLAGLIAALIIGVLAASVLLAGLHASLLVDWGAGLLACALAALLAGLRADFFVARANEDVVSLSLARVVCVFAFQFSANQV